MICATLITACFAQYLPPKEFDYEPTKIYHVVALPEHLVHQMCKFEVWSCAMVRPTESVIIINDTLTGENREIVLRHEKAHINGWALTEGHNKGRVIYNGKKD